jgi:hypothetical protein
VNYPPIEVSGGIRPLHYEETARYIRGEAHAPAGRLGLPEIVTVVDLAGTAALIKGYNDCDLLERVLL